MGVEGALKIVIALAEFDLKGPQKRNGFGERKSRVFDFICRRVDEIISGRQKIRFFQRVGIGMVMPMNSGYWLALTAMLLI